MNDILLLVAESQTADEYGDPVTVSTERQVFCRVQSVGAKEFYQAAATGLKPEIKFVLADYLDYKGEMIAVHDGERYHVLRTYRNGTELELTCYTEVNPS